MLLKTIKLAGDFRMTTLEPASLVVSYSPDGETIKIQSMDAAAINALNIKKLTFPIFLDELNHRLDDEFARRLGASLISALVVSHPELKQYVFLTKPPVDELGDSASPSPD
jgi:hypothetical protein